MTKASLPPGFSLCQVLEGHTETINGLDFSPAGEILASSSFDGSIILWEMATGKLQQRLLSPSPSCYPRVVKFSPGGQWLAVGSSDKSIQLWSYDNLNQIAKLERILLNHVGSVNTVAWSPDSRWLASGSEDSTVVLWNTHTWQLQKTLTGHSHHVNTLAFSPDGQWLASGADDKLIRLWNLATGQVQRTLKGHAGMVFSVVFTPLHPWLLSAASDKTIRVWDLDSGRPLRVLEGHTDAVYHLALSHDGQLLASKSDDDTIRLWHGEATAQLSVLVEPSEQQLWLGGLCFHPQQPWLATLGQRDRIIQLWQLEINAILAYQPVKTSITNHFSKWFSKIRQLTTATSSVYPPPDVPSPLSTPSVSPSVHYTTAKIALVGDSGVGKTGLGWRIAHGYFKEQPSTHGQQFWVIDDLGATRGDGTECEAVLWDLAGQPDYRLIHALFLDTVDLALVMFDPTHQQEPLKGVEYWLNQLNHQGSHKPGQSLLVGARVDRGVATLTAEELQQFCQHHGVAHGYWLTSALTGEGLPELMQRIQQAIHWEEMTATVTTLTFRRIKEFVLALKEEGPQSKVLWSPAVLRSQLEPLDPTWQFTEAELLTALQHLANHGYVTLLRSSAGERWVLLAPELLINLASSLILEARRNEKGLGALEEAKVLQGNYCLPELSKLSVSEQEILLDAALVLFLEHTVCVRQTINGQIFLVFPSLINQKRPAIDKIATIDDISYTIIGSVENIYASLVVLLGYTHAFTRVQQWQNQAQYEIGNQELCGLRKMEEREGELELVLYFSQQTQSLNRGLFRSLVERFLQGREVTVTAYLPVVCSVCGYQQERTEVTKRLKTNKWFMFCGECGSKIELTSAETGTLLNHSEREVLESEQSLAYGRAQFAKALVWVKSYLRDRIPSTAVPSCFISYAWGVPAHEQWVRKFAEDMWDAGIEVILDDWDNSIIGSSVPRFISRLENCDFIVVVGTPLFLQKYQNKVSATGSVVAAEVDLIAQRLIRTEKEKSSVLPLLLESEDWQALPALLRGRSYADFRDKNCYFMRLFDLLLTIYRIDFREAAVRDLREELRLAAQRGV